MKLRFPRFALTKRQCPERSAERSSIVPLQPVSRVRFPPGWMTGCAQMGLALCCMASVPRQSANDCFGPVFAEAGDRAVEFRMALHGPGVWKLRVTPHRGGASATYDAQSSDTIARWTVPFAANSSAYYSIDVLDSSGRAIGGIKKWTTPTWSLDGSIGGYPANTVRPTVALIGTSAERSIHSLSILTGRLGLVSEGATVLFDATFVGETPNMLKAHLRQVLGCVLFQRSELVHVPVLTASGGGAHEMPGLASNISSQLRLFETFDAGSASRSSPPHLEILHRRLGLVDMFVWRRDVWLEAQLHSTNPGEPLPALQPDVWLADALRASPAIFKILVLGSRRPLQYKAGDLANDPEGAALIKRIREFNVSGLVLASASDADTRIVMHPTKNEVGYDLLELLVGTGDGPLELRASRQPSLQPVAIELAVSHSSGPNTLKICLLASDGRTMQTWERTPSSLSGAREQDRGPTVPQAPKSDK